MMRWLINFVRMPVRLRQLPRRVDGKWMLFADTEDLEWNGENWEIVGRYCIDCGAPIDITQCICPGCEMDRLKEELEEAFEEGYTGHIFGKTLCVWKECPNCGGVLPEYDYICGYCHHSQLERCSCKRQD
mgnify:CR=1 FL=1